MPLPKRRFECVRSQGHPPSWARSLESWLFKCLFKPDFAQSRPKFSPKSSWSMPAAIAPLLSAERSQVEPMDWS